MGKVLQFKDSQCKVVLELLSHKSPELPLSHKDQGLSYQFNIMYFQKFWISILDVYEVILKIRRVREKKIKKGKKKRKQLVGKEETNSLYCRQFHNNLYAQFPLFLLVFFFLTSN